jgi:hypothetical protein
MVVSPAVAPGFIPGGRGREAGDGDHQPDPRNTKGVATVKAENGGARAHAWGNDFLLLAATGSGVMATALVGTAMTGRTLQVAGETDVRSLLHLARLRTRPIVPVAKRKRRRLDDHRDIGSRFCN